jgi:hypothetical protein
MWRSFAPGILISSRRVSSFSDVRRGPKAGEDTRIDYFISFTQGVVRIVREYRWSYRTWGAYG